MNLGERSDVFGFETIVDGGTPVCSCLVIQCMVTTLHDLNVYDSFLFWKMVGIIFRSVVMRFSDLICGLNISSLLLWCFLLVW